MNKSLINNPYRNPFHNRFHVPVHSRLDEMQSYTHHVWLNDNTSSDEEQDGAQQSPLAAVAGAFALVLLVAFSAVFLSKIYF
jgi:hypothetical protein